MKPQAVLDFEKAAGVKCVPVEWNGRLWQVRSVSGILLFVIQV